MPRLAKNASKSAKRERVHEEMHKYKMGTLRSGSKRGRKVKSRKQAIAIALSEAGMSKRNRKRRAVKR